MKYVFKNIKGLIKNDFYMFLLIIVTVAGSCFMIHFAYAMYQNFMVEKRSDLKGINTLILEPDYELEKIDIHGDLGTCRYQKKNSIQQTGTVELLKDMARDMSLDMQNDIKCMSVTIVVDGYPMDCFFSVDNGKFVLSEDWIRNVKNNGIIHSGRIYSDKEFDAGEKVAVAFDVHYINVGNNPFMESMLSRDEKWVILGNEKYKVIGWGSTGVDAPYIPITSVPGDTILEGGIQIDFKHALTNQEKDELTRLCNTELNGLFSVPQIHTLNLDQIYLYNTIIAICVLIIVCSGLNFALIYRYILMTRRKSIIVFQVCGMTVIRAVLVYVAECLTLMLPVYFLTVLGFQSVLPVLKKYYYYMNSHYPMAVYKMLFETYFSVSLVILLAMILYTFLADHRIKVGGGRQ